MSKGFRLLHGRANPTASCGVPGIMIKVPFHRLVIPVFFILILTVASLGAKDNPGDSTDVPDKIPNKAEAYRAALRFTGFDKAKGFDSASVYNSIKEMTTKDSSVPFLSDSISNKMAWEIVFRNIEIYDTNTIEGLQYRGRKDFVVWLDYETGRLLKISAVLSDKNENIPAELDSGSSENQISRTPEKYLDLMSFYPKSPLYRVLNERDRVIGYAVRSKRITAVFVNYVPIDGSNVESAVWAINFQGLPTIRRIGQYHYTSWRVIVRDSDMKYLLGSLAPLEYWMSD